MPPLRTVLVAIVLGPLCALAVERPLGFRLQALSRQPTAGELQQIQPGHYVYLHTDDTPGVSSTFNSGFIVTGEGVVVVDALGSDAIAREAREAIGRGRSRRPGSGSARLPDQTYRESVTLHLGGKEIRVLHLGRAHTRGDSIVFVPEDRIAYLSEVFNYDEFPYTRDSYPSDWLRALEAAEALEADVFVPGHGFLPDDRTMTRAGLQGHRQITAGRARGGGAADCGGRDRGRGGGRRRPPAARALPGLLNRDGDGRPPDVRGADDRSRLASRRRGFHGLDESVHVRRRIVVGKVGSVSLVLGGQSAGATNRVRPPGNVHRAVQFFPPTPVMAAAQLLGGVVVEPPGVFREVEHEP